MDTGTQGNFSNMEKIMARETLLDFPDLDKQFEIHNDACKIQLEDIISNCEKSIEFYSIKSNLAQT